MAKIEICTFGEFRIIVNGIDIVQKIKTSKKKILLLEYLILNKDKAVPVSNLVDVLWSEDEEVNLESTLKTLVSRLRKDLTDEGVREAIITKRGAYMWNPELDCDIDIFRMEDLCKQVMHSKELTEEKREQFEEIMYLYTGDLLPNTAIDTFVAPKAYYYKNLYIEAVKVYLRLLCENDEQNEIIKVCKISLELDPFEAIINLEFMKALVKIGKSKEAIAQYQNVTNLYYSQLGLEPADEILQLYKELIKQERKANDSIEEILSQLKEEDSARGALVCEYTIFKDIYKLLMRNFKRNGVPVFLAVVDLCGVTSRDIIPLEVDIAMQGLQEIMQGQLRTGDIIARYSLRQFVLLMPLIKEYSAGRMVVERMRTAFYRKSENIKFRFDYKLLQINDD